MEEAHGTTPGDVAPLTFYFGSGSSFVWKVWFALEHKKIRYVAKQLSFDAGDLLKPEYLAINPRHKVPAIVDRGFALYESGPIVEYLEDRYATSGEPLWPGDARARAVARRVAAEAEAYVLPPIQRLNRELLARRDGEPDREIVTQARKTVEEELALVARGATGDFIAGPTLSAADFALYPILAFLGRIDERRPGSDFRAIIPDGMRRWMKRIEALPYFDKTYPPHWKK